MCAVAGPWRWRRNWNCRPDDADRTNDRAADGRRGASATPAQTSQCMLPKKTNQWNTQNDLKTDQACTVAWKTNVLGVVDARSSSGWALCWPGWPGDDEPAQKPIILIGDAAAPVLCRKGVVMRNCVSLLRLSRRFLRKAQYHFHSRSQP